MPVCGIGAKVSPESRDSESVSWMATRTPLGPIASKPEKVPTKLRLNVRPPSVLL